jgi:hypothetical protein
MKSLVYAALAAAALAAPVLSFAQSNDQPLTREQVQQELVQLAQAGFNPANANTVDFPTNIQAAGANSMGQDSGYGPAANGSSQAGHPSSGTSGMKPVFFGQ